jgi:hypothetical protein
VTDAVPVRQGDILGYPGAYGPTQRLLHVEIFSNEGTAQSKTDGTGPDWTGWTVIGDPATFEENHACDRVKLLGELDGAGPEGVKDGKLSAAEIVSAAGSPAFKSRLEKMAVVHGTEWSRIITNSWWERMREKLRDLYSAWVSHVESVQWWHQLPADAGLPEPGKVLHFHPVGFVATANTWLKQFSLDDRDRIFKVVKEAESGGVGKNPYAAANEDYEYTGAIPTSYTGKVHIGLSWGIIQFTQDGGALGLVLKRMRHVAPGLFEQTFGPNWADLLALTEPSGAYIDAVYTHHHHSGLSRWRKEGSPSGVNYRGSRVRPIPFRPGATPEDLWTGSWKAAFKEAGNHEEFKRAQRTIAYREYFDPALRLCQRWNIRSDRGIAIALDRTIQQGVQGSPGIFKAASIAAGGTESSFAPASEREFLGHIADAFSADPVQKTDVANRVNKLLSSPNLEKEGYDPASYAASINQE